MDLRTNILFRTGKLRFKKKKKISRGLPWQSSGSDSVFPLEGTWVRSLVGELSFQMPRGMAKKKKKKISKAQSLKEQKVDLFLILGSGWEFRCREALLHALIQKSRLLAALTSLTCGFQVVLSVATAVCLNGERAWKSTLRCCLWVWSGRSTHHFC